MTRLAEFVASLEGCRLKAYEMEFDIAGVETMGYGHLLTDDERDTGLLEVGAEHVPWVDGITKLQAVALLDQDLAPFIVCVQENVKVPLTPDQKIALVSFAFNCGRSEERR